jgi:hypothetical protein
MNEVQQETESTARASDLKSHRDYLFHLHNYIYNLKKEAEERAKAILTAVAFYVLALMWIIKFASDKIHDQPQAPVLSIAVLVSALVGFVFVALSLFYALRTFSPIVIDSSSPMEPEAIVKQNLSIFSKQSLLLTPEAVTLALSQEIHAVAQVQIRRSALVRRSSRFFVAALSAFGIALALMVATFILEG